jgi:spore maturation protein CgeB
MGDAQAFASAVARLLDHPDERARLAANTAARIAARHDDRAASHVLAAALGTLPGKIGR